MTDAQLRAVQWLNRAFYADKAALAWREKLERDRALAERLSRCGDGVGGAAANGTESALLRFAQTERDLRGLLCELAAVREEIAKVIAGVEPQDLQALLVRHYLAYEPWETVAEKMHYSVRAVKYKHKAALDQVCIVLHFEM